MIVKNLLWIAPFAFFIAGFMLARSFFQIDHLATPSVVGNDLYQAFTTLSNQNLSARLTDQKIDPDLPDGTVLSQTPAPGQMVKPRQTIFLAISKKPELPIAPSFEGQNLTTILRQAKASRMRLKHFFIESAYPADTCIAQLPAAGKAIEDGITIYIAKELNQQYIWPDLTGKPLEQIVQFLEQYRITPHIIDSGTTRRSANPTVIDQRPLAGTLISIAQKQLPIVQLYIQ